MELLKRHVKHTGSTLAARLLTDWSATAKLFVKVMPRDYKRVLEGKSQFGAVTLEPIVLSNFDAVALRGRPWVRSTGFIEIHRQKQPYRPVAERLHDWREVYLPYQDIRPARDRPRGAWTAGFRSATRAVRSAT